MDKMLAIIIIFLGISAVMAAILAMGAVPKIFQNAEVINQTQDATKNQTDIIIKQFSRENNTTQKILENQNKSLNNQAILIKDMQKSIKQNYLAIEQNHNISNYILDISNEHKQVAKDHDKLQIDIQSVTDNIQEITSKILNLTKSDSKGANEHRQSTQLHHEKLLELITKLDENILGNMTDFTNNNTKP